MLKKLLVASTVALAVSSTSAFAQCGGPYLGASLGLTNTIYQTGSAGDKINFGVRNALLNAFAGYGVPVGCNVYLGGEVFAGYNTNGNKVVDLSEGTSISARSNYTYGISVIPGYKLSDCTMVYARAGVVNTRFKVTGVEDGVSTSANRNAVGGQFGVGFQTALAPCVDLRGEYAYTTYRPFNIEGTKFSPSSDQYTLGLVYKFD